MKRYTPHPNRNSIIRQQKQDFKRRYNNMSEDERKKFDKEVDNLGCIICGIVALIMIVFTFIKIALTS